MSYKYGRSYDFFSDMVTVCEMTLEEGLNFVSPSRRHVKEGVITPDESEPTSSYSNKLPFTAAGYQSPSPDYRE